MKENEQKIGAIESIVEGVKAIAPGLTLDKIAKDSLHEGKQMFLQGAHEISAALFNGNAFVMYPRGTREDGKELPEQEQAMDAPQRQQERGGRGM